MQKAKDTLLNLLNKIPSASLFGYSFRYLNNNNFGIVVALHRVTETIEKGKEERPNTFIEITVAKLEEILVALSKLKVNFVTLAQLKEALALQQKPSRPLLHFSFDDGYLDNFTLAFPLFKKYNIPFSIFIASDFINDEKPFLWWYILEEIINEKQEIVFSKYDFSVIATDYEQNSKKEIFERCRHFLLEHIDADPAYFKSVLLPLGKRLPEIMNWQQLNIMLQSGLCEVGIHTKSHARFTNLSAVKKLQEIVDCKKEIEIRTGAVAHYFAYPYGANIDIGDTTTLNVLMQTVNVKLAFTTIAGELNYNAEAYLLPRIFLNNNCTSYTLRSRLSGAYQRSILKRTRP